MYGCNLVSCEFWSVKYSKLLINFTRHITRSLLFIIENREPPSSSMVSTTSVVRSSGKTSFQVSLDVYGTCCLLLEVISQDGCPKYASLGIGVLVLFVSS